MKTELKHKPNGSKPTKALCVCGHIGDCPESDHKDSKLELGHGKCTVKGCDCQRFIWKGFLDES
jgi:hypothetical protein